MAFVAMTQARRLRAASAIITDTLGCMLFIIVHSAAIQDRGGLPISRRRYCQTDIPETRPLCWKQSSILGPMNRDLFQIIEHELTLLLVHSDDHEGALHELA